MLTASDVGAVLGDSPFADAQKVNAEKSFDVIPSGLNNKAWTLNNLMLDHHILLYQRSKIQAISGSLNPTLTHLRVRR